MKVGTLTKDGDLSIRMETYERIQVADIMLNPSLLFQFPLCKLQLIISSRTYCSDLPQKTMCIQDYEASYRAMRSRLPLLLDPDETSRQAPEASPAAF